MKKSNLVVLQNVSKIYQMEGVAVPALISASLQIKAGEFVSIMGPSGSGKSTLMHLIGCLDTPTTGRVLIEGEDVSRLSEEKLARIRNEKIGFIFQAFNLLPRTSALTNVTLPLFYAGKSAAEGEALARQSLIAVGLEKRAIMDIFRQLNQKGQTVVIVTHEIEIAKQAKRIIKIKDGEIQ